MADSPIDRLIIFITSISISIRSVDGFSPSLRSRALQPAPVSSQQRAMMRASGGKQPKPVQVKVPRRSGITQENREESRVQLPEGNIQLEDNFISPGLAKASKDARNNLKVARKLDALKERVRSGHLNAGGKNSRVKGARTVLEFRDAGTGARLYVRKVKGEENHFEVVGESDHQPFTHAKVLKLIKETYGDEK